MLNILRRVVQEVNSTENLEQALLVIVEQVKAALQVDVCSVYLVNSDQTELVLMATDGLYPDSLYKVSLKFSEGLVGLVAQRAEPVNLDNAPDHPQFKYFPETGEERYHAFLGVPVIHQRRLLGVLVIQQLEQRRFDDEHAAFLITLAAQLASAISHAEISGEINALRRETGRPDLFIHGVSGAPGVGIGTAWVVFASADLEAVPNRIPDDQDREIRLFKEAVQAVRNEMLDLKARMAGFLPSSERVLFDAFVMLLSSDTLVDRTIEHIAAGNWAPGALRETIQENAAIFDEMEDEYMRERGNDIRDLGRRILMYLEKSEQKAGLQLPERTILIGENVSVSELADVPPQVLAGVVSGKGSASSHVAILARALGVPAVMGAADLPFGRLDGREVIVDGYTGRVHIEPSRQVKEEFWRLALEEKELAAGLDELADKPAITPDGERVAVYVNSGLLADINMAFQSESDGIGLYRTELPFMVRERFPTEDEQYRTYRQVLESIAPRPVILRTLDVGGDKVLPYFPIDEENPFLGWRGIRITLDHPEIFLTQVKAMLRASVGLNNMKVLLPMINAAREVDDALQLLKRSWSELIVEKVDVAMPQVGIMVEIPAAVYMIEPLARKVDFISVGTNDLVQFVLAVDRNNAQVSELYCSLDPAVLRALKAIVEGAHKVNKPVSICGEMASDPAAVILLLGLGVESLSVSVAGLPRVKWVINSFTRSRARELLAQVYDMEDSAQIRGTLNDALVEVGLGGLVRAGKR